MPKPPFLNPNLQKLKPSVFTTLTAQFKLLSAPPIPLHLGDTYRAPPAEAQWPQVIGKTTGNPYQYASPAGMEELRAAVAESLAKRGLSGLTTQHIAPTSGGTGALSLLAHTWFKSGDEVLILSPFWPIIRGIVDSVGAVPVEVPFYGRVKAGEGIDEILDPYVTDRTVAVYVCSPNNPCGTVLSPEELQALATWSQRHDLWVIADEAYYDFTYGDHHHSFLAALPGMAERTATVLTASKSYALAGTRVGFLIGDPAWLDPARLMSTHITYQLPIVCQIAALGAIEHSADWLAETRGLYQRAAERVQQRLQAKFAPAQGGAYVFVDLREALNGRHCVDYVSELLREGVCIAPGEAFGKDFEGWARVCYTSVPPDQLELGIDRLNRSFERLAAGRPL